jgi:flagellar biosynthesis protein FlhA
VLDAPPHSEAVHQQNFRMAVLEATRKGVRICPVLCSGADILTEYVRQSLKRAISNRYFPPNETTSVITLDPKLEKEIMASVKQTEQGSYLTLDPDKTKAIMNAVGKEAQKLENLGKNAIIVTSPIVRTYFKRLTEDYYRDLIVISYNEIESNVELQSVGMVTA